jgi:hypothetical protein
LPDRQQIVGSVKKYAILESKPFAVSDFIGDFSHLAIGVRRNERHKMRLL